MKLANAIQRSSKRSTGKDKWATEKDIRSLLKMPENGGVVIGGYAGKPLVYGGDNHVVAVGVPGSGKTAGLVIPSLMLYKGSVVVHDVGGELYKATADHRRDMGQKVVRFAPGEADTSGDLDLYELQNGDTPVTMYLISDGARQVSLVHQALLASIIKNGLSARIQYQEGHVVPHYRHKLLLLLDDYGSFDGGVPGLDDSVAFMAGYGIQSFIVVQNAAQMKNLGSIVANSHIRVFVSPDAETAEYLSKMMGGKPVPSQNGPDGIPCFTLRAGNAPIMGAIVPAGLPDR
jgi:type IV secretory pathway TraG/TraD family ATPase VirD4